MKKSVYWISSLLLRQAAFCLLPTAFHFTTVTFTFAVADPFSLNQPTPSSTRSTSSVHSPGSFGPVTNRGTPVTSPGFRTLLGPYRQSIFVSTDPSAFSQRFPPQSSASASVRMANPQIVLFRCIVKQSSSSRQAERRLSHRYSTLTFRLKTSEPRSPNHATPSWMTSSCRTYSPTSLGAVTVKGNSIVSPGARS